MDGQYCYAPVAGTSVSLWTATVFSANQEVYCTCTYPPFDPNHITLILRSAADYADAYYAEFRVTSASGGDQVRIYKRVSSVDTLIGGPWAIDDITNVDRLGFRAVGTALEVYFRDVFINGVTDTTHAGSGRIGLKNSDDGPRMNDFGGGNYTQTVVQPRRLGRRVPGEAPGPVAVW